MKKGIRLSKGLILFDYRLREVLKQCSVDELKFYRNKILKDIDIIISKKNKK